MKYVRFYLEHDSAKHKRRGEHNGNVLALLDTFGNGFRPVYMGDDQYTHECISAVFFHPNSAVCGSQCHVKYLREQCKRIPEAKAREIHPRLFDRLDDKD